MGLTSLSQLQPVLNHSQENVSIVQVVKITPAQVLLVMQFLHRKQRTARTQPKLLPTVHALQTLHQELDIADPPVVQLDINAVESSRSLMSSQALLVHLLPG